MQTTQPRRPETSRSRTFIRQFSGNLRLSVSRMGAAMNCRRRQVIVGLALLLLIVGATAVWSRPALLKWFERPVVAKATGDTQLGQHWTRQSRIARMHRHGFLDPASPEAPPLLLTSPTNLRVTAAADQSISVAWDAPTSGSFANYRVERSTTFTGSFDFVANVAAGTLTFNNTSFPTGGVHSYLYRVRTVNIFGDMSPPSNLAMGTTITFTDATLTVGVTEIKAQHIYDLRNAINAVRALTAMSVGSWTTTSLEQQIVKAQDVQELRDQLDAALSPLSISLSDYEDDTLATGTNGTPIKKVHIEELRTRSTKGKSTSTGPADNFVDSATARLDALNRTGGGGDDPLSRNFNWSIPLVSLPGRSGLDLGLSLAYNSLATWTRHGNVISFDDDYGFPAPGFRLGFPVIEPVHYNAQAGKDSYLMITPSGARVELRQVGTSSLYQAVDSSYLLLDASSSTMFLRTTDGTRLSYVWKVDNFKCTEIKDRNGNVISINYDPTTGRLTSVVDTLNRTITFNYTGSDLSSISQSWGGSPHYWAQFTYANTTINTKFSTSLAVYGPANDTTVRTLTKVKFADDSYFQFDYTTWGQVWKISQYTGESTPTLLNYRSYNLPADNSGSALDDCPRFTQRSDWAKYWNRDSNGNEQAVTTSFAVPSSATIPSTSQTGLLALVTATDGTYQKLYYGSSSGSPAWQHGLIRRTETYEYNNSTAQRTTTTAWDQDDTNASYQLNPRVTETTVGDPAGNLARTTVAYDATTLSDGTTINLPEDTREYQADGTTQLRRSHIEYNLDSAYVSRRILGLDTERTLYAGPASSETLVSKVSYQYDQSGSIDGNDAPVQHDNTNYTSSFVSGRGNVSTVTQHDVVNSSQSKSSTIKYNTAGSVVRATDPLGHYVTTSYTDQFSANGTDLDSALGFSTLAYPTTVTDPDGFTSTTRYNYAFGGSTRKQTPKPNETTTSAGNQNGPVQITEYDSIGRPLKVRNTVDSAYTRYIYGPNYVETYATVNTVGDEAHSFQYFDGASRVIGKASNHPGSTGGYSGQQIFYNAMGRVIKTSNPTETSKSGNDPHAWSATGDDASAGWLYTQQTYDWKGRPLVTTNVDSTTKTASYGGCGCAGGEVVTLTDEVGRVQKIYADVVGRKWKTEVLDASSNTYTASVNSFNGRDQVTAVKSYKGAATSDFSCPSNTCMQSATTYDGYGRVASRQLPQQTAAATFAYNADDTLYTVADPRGVVATNTYNSRRLLTEVAYTPVTGIDSLASVSFTYDAAGNRIFMSDGMGGHSYTYDQLSRMTSEARSITGFGGSYSISYSYNKAGQLTSVTDPSGAEASYEYDVAGRLNSMPADGYTGVSNFLSSPSYRASGAMKQATYGNGVQLDLSYNSRMLLSQYKLSSTNFNVTTNMTYYNDGRTNTAYHASASPFDRKYEFDFAGRLKDAYSGPEAHGAEAPSSLEQGTSPYRQNYTYDEWSNVTLRTGRIWSTNWEYEAASYGSDNRRVSDLTYDSAGNVTWSNYDGGRTYDAAGRPATFFSTQNWQVFPNWPTTHADGPALETRDTFDGAGQVIKHVSRTRHDDSYDNGSVIYLMSDTTTTTYYIHSTVLGGKTIAELNASGAKTKGYVYAGGTRVATQTVSGSSNSVALESTNPVTGSASAMDASGNGGSSQEPDPLGRDLAAAPDPLLVVDPIASPKLNSPMYLEYSWGPSQEYLNANDSWGQAMDAMYDRGLAEYYWSQGNRNAVQRILERNPNVGVEYNRVGFGQGSASGTLFGAEAFRLLNAIGAMTDSGFLKQTGGPGFSGGGYAEVIGYSVGGSQNPLKGATVTGTTVSEKNPCKGVTAEDLDYHRNRSVAGGRVENGIQHITRNHILLDGSDSEILTADTRLSLAQSKSKYLFQSGTALRTAQASVMNLNAYLLNSALATGAYAKQWNGNIKMSIRFPGPIRQPESGRIFAGIGFDVNEGWLPTMRATLILGPDCREVITSFPGR